jgi:hypothetical protein
MATRKGTMVIDKATMETTRDIVGMAKDMVVAVVVALAEAAAAAVTMATISPLLKL